MNPPVCSVIIPSYNCMAYLPTVLASVALQRISGLEILIFDDGSTDGTWEWLQDEIAENPHIRAFRGGGLGPAKARNLLINHAKSDLVAFLDADDVWWPDKLRNDIAYHSVNPDIGFTFTDYIHVDPHGRTYRTAFKFWEPEFIDVRKAGFQRIDSPVNALLTCNAVGTSCVVAKRKSLQNAKGFATELPSAEDWDLWLRLAETQGVAVSSAVTMSYLMRPGSETAKKGARIAAMNSIIDRYENHASCKAIRIARSRRDVAIAESARAVRQPLTAARAHFSAFVKAPSRRVAWATFADIAGVPKKLLRDLTA